MPKVKSKNNKELPPILDEDKAIKLSERIGSGVRFGKSIFLSYKQSIIDGPFGSDLLAKEYINDGIRNYKATKY